MSFHPRRDQPLRFTVPSRLDPTGAAGPTRHQARRGKWVRVGPGLHLPVHVDRSLPEQRAVELCARYPGSALSGWGSLWFHGATYFDGLATDGRTPLPLLVALGPDRGCRPSDGVRLTYEPLDPGDVVMVAGIPVTTPVRALFDHVRSAPGWREAVVAIDMAVAAGLLTTKQLDAYAQQRRRWRRTSRVLSTLPHCRSGPESPKETVLRLLWTVDAALPRPLLNETVLDHAGRFVCRADLLDPVAGMVGEYDGADHRSASRHTSDVRRQERCRAVGLEYVTVTAIDLLDPGVVVARLLSARARARFDAPDQRAWRLK